MMNRDLIYEQQLYENALRMQRILIHYREQSEWLEHDYLAIERALQILIESLIGLARSTLEMLFNIHVAKSREAIDILHLKGIFDINTYQQLNKMIGFRNILVHDYLNLNPEIVRTIVKQSNDTLIITQLEMLLKCLEKT